MNPKLRNQLTILSDSPRIEPDLLDFKRYVEPLVEIITGSNTETPFTIGIFGSWGTGKTTLMQIVEGQVQQNNNYPTVWFNPWLYQTEDNLIVPLLQTIQDSFQDSPITRFKEAALRIGTVVAEISAGMLLKTITAGQVSLDDLEKREQIYNERHKKVVSILRTLRNELQKVINYITEEGKKGRLVIYIDDLDRCVPTKIIGLLEAIKLFLDLRHVIVFMAIDKEVVQQGIQVFYKDFDLPKEKFDTITADYMDKMIQLPLYLRPLGSDQIENYLKHLPFAPQLVDCMELFQKCLQPNPRKIKRVLNIFALNTAILERDPSLQEDFKQSKRLLLAKLIIIQQQWHDLYRHTITYPEIPALLERVYRGKLDINRPNEWFFLKDERREELRKICASYYPASPQLVDLFIYGEESFQDVELEKYLSVLG